MAPAMQRVLFWIKSALEMANPSIHLEQNQGYGGGIQAGLKSLQTYRPRLSGGLGRWTSVQHPSLLYTKSVSRVQTSPKPIVLSVKMGIEQYYLFFIREACDNGRVHRTSTDAQCSEVFEQLQLESHDWFLDRSHPQSWKLGGIIHNEPAIMEPRASGESMLTLDTGWIFQKYDSMDVQTV